MSLKKGDIVSVKYMRRGMNEACIGKYNRYDRKTHKLYLGSAFDVGDKIFTSQRVFDEIEKIDIKVLSAKEVFHKLRANQRQVERVTHMQFRMWGL
ncbi:MAG: hypothetical protein Q8L47_01355 [bacterium]|nr:hypothetical protein [bacterium]